MENYSTEIKLFQFFALDGMALIILQVEGLPGPGGVEDSNHG